MAGESPFGRANRVRVLEEYFASAGSVSAANAWEHVYRCLLWMNQAAGLAHIYDSNHMQPGGNFHSRAVRFSDELCRRWQISRKELATRIDRLFQGCVAHLRSSGAAAVDEEIESELTSVVTRLLEGGGVAAEASGALAKRIETVSREFFTIGNKRKNALGEGFEDLLFLLLQRVAKIPPQKLALRTPVSQLPGFRRSAVQKAQRGAREPRPDIAIHDEGVTHVVVTAKWSMRQDRETQFQSEYTTYRRNKIQPTELRFALITNEFDIARLNNVARAIPEGVGGYVFHNIYHINPELLVHTHDTRIGDVAGWLKVGKIAGLAEFLRDMGDQFGEH